MPETVLTTEVCEACGSDVRDESLFCYNCGERVRADESAVVSKKPEDKIDPLSQASRPPLRSAASLRKQRRAYNRQPVEIIWERPSRGPVGFVITTIVLAMGALVLFIVALYLR
jgi:hypothetical protein